MGKHIVVLMGGLSAEREVSFVTGKAMMEAAQALGHKTTAVDPDYNLAARLTELKPDIVLNALHGTYGEDGATPGLLEMMNIPYTHSGIVASAIALDKPKTKAMASSFGVRTPKEKLLITEELQALAEQGLEPMERPFVIKPAAEGSSVGLEIVNHSKPNWFTAGKWKPGAKLLVEEYIAGQEVSVAVLRGEALGVLELRPHSGIYDYEAKYTDGKTDHILPAELPATIYKQAMDYAALIHNILGCRTLSRSDFRFDPSKGEDGLYFLEVNTHPGCTPLSIVPEIAASKGIVFTKLIEYLLEDATCDLQAASK